MIGQWPLLFQSHSLSRVNGLHKAAALRCQSHSATSKDILASSKSSRNHPEMKIEISRQDQLILDCMTTQKVDEEPEHLPSILEVYEKEACLQPFSILDMLITQHLYLGIFKYSHGTFQPQSQICKKVDH